MRTPRRIVGGEESTLAQMHSDSCLRSLSSGRSYCCSESRSALGLRKASSLARLQGALAYPSPSIDLLRY